MQEINVVRQSTAVVLFEWAFFPLLAFAAVSAMASFLGTEYEAIASLLIAVAVLLVTWVAERLHPLNPDWNRSRGDLQPDVASILLVGVGLESLLKVLGPVLATLAFVALDLPAGYRVLGDSLPFWLEVVMVVLIVEFAKYWFHRISHNSAFWWPLHSVHHSVKRMHLLNGFRIHPLYHFITFVLGVLPCHLLGASDEALIMNAVILALGGSIQHCNIRLRYGWLNYIFNTNELHHWHHSLLIGEANHNYGAVLVIYDVLFGTHYYRPDAAPAELGIENEAHYPMNNYWQQLLVPFRRKPDAGSVPLTQPVDFAAESDLIDSHRRDRP